MRPLAAAIVNADVEFVEIPDSGHFSAVEHPQEVSQALLALVRKVRSAQ
jgi:pimeloyl-ACP methyl ester carboxylesterase